MVRPGYKRTEVGEIPADWECAPFVSIVGRYFDYRGRTPRKLGMDWGGGEILALSANNVLMGRIAPEREAYRGSAVLYDRWMTKGDCDKGDILLTMEAPLGNVAQIPDSEHYILSQRVILIRPIPDLRRDYLAHFMRGMAFQSQLLASATGSTAQGIQRQRLDQLAVCWPRTPQEQNAIATSISNADALIESLEHLLAKKRAIKQGAMQALLTGAKRLPGFSEPWRSIPFSELARPRRDRIDPRTAGAGTFCIELEHLQSATGHLLGSTSTHASASLKSVFRAGDVLFGKLRAYLRKHWLADRQGCCSTEIWVLAPTPEAVTSQFLYQLVTTDQFIEVASTAYGTHMPRSDWRVVSGMQVSVPSLPEQAAIAEVLTDLDADLDATTAKLHKARAIKQGMMQELLTGRIRLA